MPRKRCFNLTRAYDGRPVERAGVEPEPVEVLKDDPMPGHVTYPHVPGYQCGR